MLHRYVIDLFGAFELVPFSFANFEIFCTYSSVTRSFLGHKQPDLVVG